MYSCIDRKRDRYTGGRVHKTLAEEKRFKRCGITVGRMEEGQITLGAGCGGPRYDCGQGTGDLNMIKGRVLEAYVQLWAGCSRGCG